MKGNQARLQARLKRLADDAPASDCAETVTRRAHGRQEHRRVETFDLDGRLGDGWDRLIVQAARVTRLTWVKQTSTGLWSERTDVAFYVSQARLSADAFGRAVRAHWAIENRHHHVRDVTLGEDHSRIRTRPELIARFRSFALNILRAHGVSNIASARYANALNPDNLIAYAQRS